MVVYTRKVVYSAQKLATSNIVSHFFMSNTRLKFVWVHNFKKLIILLNLNLYSNKLLHKHTYNRKKKKKTTKSTKPRNISLFSKGNPLKVTVYNLQKQSCSQEIAYFHELGKNMTLKRARHTQFYPIQIIIYPTAFKVSCFLISWFFFFFFAYSSTSKSTFQCALAQQEIIFLLSQLAPSPF